MEREEVLARLMSMDSEGKGKVSREELRRLLSTVGDRLTPKEIGSFFRYLKIEEGSIDPVGLVDFLYPK